MLTEYSIFKTVYFQLEVCLATQISKAFKIQAKSHVMLVNLHGIFLAQQNVTREGMLCEFFRQLHSLHLICNCNLIKL